MPFYKNDNGELLKAENWVHGPDFELLLEQKDTYTYPVNGWMWYDDDEAAYTAFGITPPVPDDPLTPKIPHPYQP